MSIDTIQLLTKFPIYKLAIKMLVGVTKETEPPSLIKLTQNC